MTDHGTFTVHVIDDDAAVRESLEALLLVAGYPVEAYASAEAYLAAADMRDCCLLLDIHMPGMGGVGLLQVLAGRQPPVPVLVLTASRDEHLHQRALALGARALLTKPVPQATLLAALHTIRENPYPGASRP
jgi:two-component system, LuxR family, response regulator FixJ